MKFGRTVEGRLEAQTQKLITPLSNEAFVPLPPFTSSPPWRLNLSSITTDPTDELIFHVMGDTGGILDPNPQKNVAAAICDDIDYDKVAFAYIVGDVVYFLGEDDQFYPQYYEPYEEYKKPILQIPGNHDGPNIGNFAKNFCSSSPTLLPEAMDSERDSMIQPYVYWTLNCKLVTIIGLYTNVPSGGVVKADQVVWLVNELKVADKSKPIIVTLHHPPYSADAHHGGSLLMGNMLDGAFSQANVIPDLVISGHVHNYQRFTRTSGLSKKLTYIVCGGSGYHNLHSMMPGVSAKQQIGDVVIEQWCAVKYGFLRLSVTPDKKITGEYIAVSGAVTGGIDTFEIDCATNTVKDI